MVRGNNGTVLVGAQAVANVTAFTYNEDAAAIRSGAMGQTYRANLADAIEVSGSVTCEFDSSDTLGQGALVAGSEVQLNLREEGDGAGKPEITVEALITQVAVDVTDGQIVTRSFQYVLGSAGTAPDKAVQT